MRSTPRMISPIACPVGAELALQFGRAADRAQRVADAVRHRSRDLADDGQRFGLDEPPLLLAQRALGAAHEPDQRDEQEQSARHRTRPDQTLAGADRREQHRRVAVQLDDGDESAHAGRLVEHRQVVLDITVAAHGDAQVLRLAGCRAWSSGTVHDDAAGQCLVEFVVVGKALPDQFGAGRPQHRAIGGRRWRAARPALRPGGRRTRETGAPDAPGRR